MKNKVFGTLDWLDSLADRHIVATIANPYPFIISLPLLLLPFYFAVTPTYPRLLLLIGGGIVSLMTLDYFGFLNYSYLLFYLIACYFVLSFVLLNSVYRYHADVFGFTIGWEDFKIPLVLLEDSEDYTFVTIFGIPIWKPFSYIKKLRKYYTIVDLSKH